jgi:hypothetical protein
MDEKFLRGAFGVARDLARPPQPDRYAVEGRLGEGAMAVVYRARDRELGHLETTQGVRIRGVLP